MSRTANSQHLRWLIMLGLALVTCAVFSRTLGNGFVGLDDNLYVTENARVQAGLTLANLGWAFSATDAANWHPLTWLSHMLDCQLYGLTPWGHHLTSVLFHAVNAVLLFHLLVRSTGSLWRSALVAALFALHPMHVESVAWVAERKDVLSTFFFLLTLLCYLNYLEHRGAGRYLFLCLSFAAGLMTKPMLVTLPFLLLLLDYWPLKRLNAGGGSETRRVLLEKAPLVALALLSSAATLVAQHKGGSVASLEGTPVLYRLGNATVAYASYLWKTVCPSGLAAIYPLPLHLSATSVAASALLLLALTALALWRVRRSSHLLVGWLWFLGALVPVIGLVQVGSQSMADRYSYIPLIGIFIMIAWSIPEPGKGDRKLPLCYGAAAALLICALTAATWRQIGYWNSDEALFSRALLYTSDNYMAHTGLGKALADRGARGAAEIEYREALRIRPSYELAHVHLGTLLFGAGRNGEAIGEFLAAVNLNPRDASAHNNLGIALSMRGDRAGALSHFAAAVASRPDHADAQYNLGVALAKEGRIAEAVHHLTAAQKLNPADRDVAFHLAQALADLQHSGGR